MLFNFLRIRRLLPFFSALSLYCSSVVAQTTFPVNGVHEKQDQYILLHHAVVHVSPTETIENGCLLLKDNRIVAVGQNCTPPKNTVAIDVKGHHIYPAFIDLFAEYGITKEKPEPNKNRYLSTKQGAYYWNESIHPEVEAQAIFSPNEKEAETLRAMGFGAVVTHAHDGIARGTGALVQLTAEPTNEVFLIGNAASFYSFKKGTAQQNYPSSQMGAIALIRQSFYDAQWYASQPSPKKEYNISLEALQQQQALPIVFEADNYRVALRSKFLADEFSKTVLIKAGGDEYRRLQEIKQMPAKWILPLNFPKAFDVEDPLDALHINLEELKHWELAPYNAHYFETEKIPFALTAFGLKTKDEFWGNLRRAVRAGLTEKTALEALTQNPAAWLGLSKELGDLSVGKIANFFISTDNIFTSKAKVLTSWVNGQPLEINAFPVANLIGNYELTIENQAPIAFEIKEGPSGLTVKTALEKSSWSIAEEDGLVALTTVIDNKTQLLSGYITSEGNFSGKQRKDDGSWVTWTAVKKGDSAPDNEAQSKKDSLEIAVGAINFPLGAYGFKEKPKAQNIAIQHATVWTSDSQGVIEDADVVLVNGKIKAIGKGVYAAEKAKVTGEWLEIDGTGMHVTPGIIDEHSHIAIESGVNEGTQSSSAEVRIGDVLNSDDINIYRQLSGGVVAAQLLHGSSNPIGGQSAIIKLRWGFAPEELKIKGADGFIKFALGENVKRSNSFDRYRFPQTRMGVEQTMIDAFTRALEYKQQWNAYLQSSAKQRAAMPSPRKDLELEALVEVLESKRFITCHSYVQSEITMLMQVADSFHFKVNTFTHILEGYKVADKMKAHGVAASTFSDWWAYKFEVNDAIPYNASLLQKMGVNTAINSDDAEMARRLNQEAAKGIKYGGMTEIEAMNMVTINPAKMLHLDKTMGSLTAGKDADVVVWTTHPLSIYAKVNYTIVDGMVLYDASKAAALQAEIEAERKRIIEKMIWAKKNKMPVEKHVSPISPDYECETMIDYE